MARGIESGRFKKRFFLEKIGPDCLFAVDETKRLLAILSSKMVSDPTEQHPNHLMLDHRDP